jgi:hypothetical protein
MIIYSSKLVWTVFRENFIHSEMQTDDQYLQWIS